jgi:transcriptional regulator with XRE-family HTH domain
MASSQATDRILFGQKLQAARKAAGLSQTQVALALGISNTEVSAYECGRHFPQTMRIVGLANALNVALEDLLPSDEPAEQAA